MAKLDSILEKRLKTKESSQKMAELAQRSAMGNLNSFAGLFSLSPISSEEQESLRIFLKRYAIDSAHNIEKDMQALSQITSEVKAISNQAILLHGERIKQVQVILKNYKEGSFSAWLIETYGNRQTPYNFLQYYELYLAMPQNLYLKMERMPRQALYTLASRNGAIEQKQKMIENYRGQTKQELLSDIRKNFPLKSEDLRKKDTTDALLHRLGQMTQELQQTWNIFSSKQKKECLSLLAPIYSMTFLREDQ